MARLTATEQEFTGAAYIAGFLRLHLGQESECLPMLDASDVWTRSVGWVVVKLGPLPLTAAIHDD
jgi:hypothetical protein